MPATGGALEATMKEQAEKGDARVDSGRVQLDAVVVLARSELSPAEADSARTGSGLRMKAAQGGTVWLEAGGVTLAEGRLARRKGVMSFVVSKVYGEEAGR